MDWMRVYCFKGRNAFAPQLIEVPLDGLVLMADWRSKISFDPKATRTYDVMRGGFVWSDELPPSSRFKDFFIAVNYLADAIAYRASLSLGEPDEQYQAAWQKIQNEFSEWPGFREERIHGHQIHRDIKAVKLRENRCFESFEFEFEDDV